MELINFNVTLYPLFQTHMAIGTKKRSLFSVIMFDRLTVIKTMDYKIYRMILKGISSSNWMHSAMKNVHLH